MLKGNFLVHGKAVPETGEVTIIESSKPYRRELVWDPVAAGRAHLSN